MTRIGIRELRQRASEYLRLVEAGETIEVTDRGRPSALITPIPQAPPLEQLRASGDVDAAETDLKDLPEPREVGTGQELPSTVLDRLRVDER
jgi:prevent-host-death family protein